MLGARRKCGYPRFRHHATTISALASQSGTTIRGVGMAGPNPLRPMLAAGTGGRAMTWLLSSPLHSSRPTQTRADQFPDRMTARSPGRLPPGGGLSGHRHGDLSGGTSDRESVPGQPSNGHLGCSPERRPPHGRQGLSGRKLTPHLTPHEGGPGRVTAGLGESREGCLIGKLGWPTGLEPVTFGSTIRCSAN